MRLTLCARRAFSNLGFAPAQNLMDVSDSNPLYGREMHKSNVLVPFSTMTLSQLHQLTKRMNSCS
jgi:hypothetical protein